MTEPAVRFETLIERHHDEIHAYLWRLLRNAGGATADVEAADLTQDVFLRAYRAFGRLRAGSNYRAWLYKIATNCAYTALRQGRRRATHSVPLDDGARFAVAAASPPPDQQLAAEEALQRVERAIAALPPKQRMAVVLRYVEELDYGAIAQALECSQDSVRANVYQALRRLRQELAEEPER
jgi:RNA polymerase sigma-70 factor (ECF subfamily)